MATTGGHRVYFEGGYRYTLLAWFSGERAEGADRELSPFEARWALARIFRGGRGSEIGDAYAAALDDTRGARARAGEVEEMLEALLAGAERGEVRLWEANLVGSSTEREVDEAPVARAAPEVREDKTWIEIALNYDDEPHEPVAFAPYRIELPDQSVREGILDGNGRARLDGIDAGNCKVSFPGFDKSDWS